MIKTFTNKQNNSSTMATKILQVELNCAQYILSNLNKYANIFAMISDLD